MCKHHAFDRTNLELEYGCGEAFALTRSIFLRKGDAEVTNLRIIELVLSADSALLPVLVVFWQFFLVPIFALNIRFAVSAVFGLHVDFAKVRVLIVVPIRDQQVPRFLLQKHYLPAHECTFSWDESTDELENGQRNAGLSARSQSS